MAVEAAARAKWEATDPGLIYELGRPIQHPLGGKSVAGLIVEPGSTPAQIKPLFDARMRELRKKIKAAKDEYFSISAYIRSMETIEDKIRRSIGVLPRMAFPVIAARREAMLTLCQSERDKSFQFEQEINVLTNRFQPALDVFAILQKA